MNLERKEEIKKCVIPVAGMGTRMLPITKSISKEMLPIGNKPIIQHLVDESLSAGCNEIIFVTSNFNKSINKHFEKDYELEKKLEESNKYDLLENLKDIGVGAKISCIIQNEPKGDGDAILRTREIIGDEPFLVLFGDNLVDNEISAAKQLVDTYKQKLSTIIGTNIVSDNHVNLYGIIESKDSGDLFKVDKFLEKPKKSDTNSRNASMGKYVVTSDIFEYLEIIKNSKLNGEIRLADAFELMRRDKNIYGINIKGQKYDTGNEIGYSLAFINYAMKDPKKREEILKYMKKFN